MNYSKFPRAIEIQTISACNAKCVICPHPTVSKELPSGSMSMDLFRRIIMQINPSWNCKIIPYLNSEPMLDQFIIERLCYIRDTLKDPDVELSTNVAALTPLKQERMVGIRLGELRLSIFGFTEKTHQRTMPGLKWSTVKRNLDHLASNGTFRTSIDAISLVMIDSPLVTVEDVELAGAYCKKHGLGFNFWGFLDRARNVDYYSNAISRPMILGCEQNRPLERIHITFTGDVILCCQDWRWKNVIGNVKNSTLTDIWNSSVYQDYRESIYDGNGKHPEICSHCKLSVPSI